MLQLSRPRPWAPYPAPIFHTSAGMYDGQATTRRHVSSDVPPWPGAPLLANRPAGGYRRCAVRAVAFATAVLSLLGAAEGRAQGPVRPVPRPPSPAGAFLAWAPTPPMGWNSWDAFATTVTEAQVLAQADVMKAHLSAHGWRYVVVDIQWYEPGAAGYSYRPQASLAMDRWGRLVPAVNRFPSAGGGEGFGPLAEAIHARGLKFGVHLLRGIPRQAVARNTPILGTPYHARDIADTTSRCPWNEDMYGVDMSKPGAQAYYDSMLELLASWGVDFLKVDDVARPYHAPEVEAIRRAIDQTGRPIVLSLSPGATPLAAAPHVASHANMWRISDDFWDRWPSLLEQIPRLAAWAPWSGPGHWPDADMLPLGVIAMGRPTRLTRDEQVALVTLWAIARSPLMMGGDLTRLDDSTLSLLVNDEVLSVDQHSEENRQLFNQDGLVAWVARPVHSDDRYVAVLNTRDAPPGPRAVAGAPVPVSLSDLGGWTRCEVRDLWQHTQDGVARDVFAPTVRWHSARLFRLSACR